MHFESNAEVGKSLMHSDPERDAHAHGLPTLCRGRSLWNAVSAVQVWVSPRRGSFLLCFSP